MEGSLWLCDVVEIREDGGGFDPGCGLAGAPDLALGGDIGIQGYAIPVCQQA